MNKCDIKLFLLLVKEHIRQDVGVFLVGVLHHMGVDVSGGGNLSMAQPLRDADAVHAAVVEHGGHGVAEGVGIDVGQIVPLAELAEPVGDAVRVHRGAVFLCKEVAAVLVIGFEEGFLFLLPLAVFLQELDSLGRYGNNAAGLFCFGNTLIDADVGGVEDGVGNGQSVLLDINLVPFQAQDLAPARAGDQEQVGDGPPLNGFQVESFPDAFHVIHLEIVDFPVYHFGQCGAAGHIVGNQAFLDGLLQHGGDQAVMFHDGFGREALAGTLVLAGLSQCGVEIVQMIGPQIGQLDVADFLVNADGQRFVPVYCGVLGAALLLQGDDIVAITGKGLTGIVDEALFELILQGGGVSLRLFSCALFTPGRLYLEGGDERFELFAVLAAAPINADGIRY